jgi:hypothetical protein
VLDDLAHPRRGDLDAVALGHLAEVVVVLSELERDRLEPVPGDVDPRGEVHDAGAEHELVIGLGLDEDDVDPGVALLPLAGHLVEALVGQELERLIADLREAHVRDPSLPRARQGGDLLLEVVDEGDQWVEDHDELRPGLDGDVDVGGRDDAAVDELPAPDLDRRVDHGKGG